MTTAHVRLPEDWRRFDRVGWIGAILLPLLLALLWGTGFGPSAYKACSARPTELRLSSDAGKITLTGKVADVADRALLVDAARQAYGANNVIDQLKVDSGVAALSWARNVPGLVNRLKAAGPAVSMTITGRDAVVTGTVADRGAKEGTVRELSMLLGADTTLKDGLVVAAPQPVAASKPPEPVVVAKPKVSEPVIAKGAPGTYRLPNGTEITIMGGGLEANVLAFLNDDSRQVDRGVWFDFDRLHFKTGSAELTPESKSQVDTVVAILKAYPSAAVKIGGYTDNVGDPANNMKLSASRAERVPQELTDLGIAGDRIEWEGYGEQHPIASNDTAEGRALNRRTALSVRRK